MSAMSANYVSRLLVLYDYLGRQSDSGRLEDCGGFTGRVLNKYHISNHESWCLGGL